jgi:hypothetical protein
MNKSAHPLLQVLKESPEYNRLSEILTGAEGPAAAFGLPEAHRAHVFAALAETRGGLLIASGEQAAEKLYQIASALSAHIVLLPARELPLVNAYAASGEGAKARISALVRLALGEKMGVIVSAEAVLQRLAPPDVLCHAAHTLHLGDMRPPRELLAALSDGVMRSWNWWKGQGRPRCAGIFSTYTRRTRSSPAASSFSTTKSTA